jgi:phage gp29-like protein
VAKVDNATWEKERNAIKRLIRNFGSSGGALFSLNTEFQLLQASNNVGEVYFRLLEYVDDAIEKLVLGQIKTSSDTGGLSGDAQTEVREDIRDADCVEIADAINAQLVAPWMAFNYPSAPLPRFEFDIKPKRDLKELSETLAHLKNAGLEADPDEMSAVFGFALTRVAPLALPAAALSLAAESTRAPAMPEAPRSPLVANAYREALGSAWLDGLIDEIDAALSDESGEKLKTLGRPGDLARVDSQALASTLERTIYAAAANGMAAKAEELDLKARKRGAKAQGGLDA